MPTSGGAENTKSPVSRCSTTARSPLSQAAKSARTASPRSAGVIGRLRAPSAGLHRRRIDGAGLVAERIAHSPARVREAARERLVEPDRDLPGTVGLRVGRVLRGEVLV